MENNVVAKECSQCFLPSQPKDKAAFYFLMCGVPFVLLWDYLVVMPVSFDEDSWLGLVHTAVSVFIAANVLGNLYMIISSELVGQLETSKIVTAVPNSDWRFCSECQKSFPPRSFHCKSCNTCTIKRDHHCAYSVY